MRLRSKVHLGIVAVVLSGMQASVGAAQPLQPPRIALVIPGPPSCVLDGFTRPALEESHLDPSTVRLYCYSNPRDVPRQMREIAASKPNILVIFASALGARVAHEADPTLSIVFADVEDPVKKGLARSLAHPGMNMTGITSNTDELLAKRIEILKEAVPSVARLGVLGNLANEDQASYWRVTQDAARSVRVDARLYGVESPSQIAPAIEAMKRDGMDALMMLPDSWFFPQRVEIFADAAKHRLPVISGNSLYADAGALLTYGADLGTMASQAYAYVHKILDGAKAGDLPVIQPARINFIVNARTAREQGVTISPTSLLRATRVIE